MIKFIHALLSATLIYVSLSVDAVCRPKRFEIPIRGSLVVMKMKRLHAVIYQLSVKNSCGMTMCSA